VALLRGDLDVNEIALKNALQVDHLRARHQATRSRRPRARRSVTGPHKLPAAVVRIVADESIRDAVNAVTGAGRRDWHVAGFVQRRDAKVAEWGVFAQARAGDPCPRCGKPLAIARGIEVGHIFQLGTKYSAALKCEFTDEKGENRPVVMGTYGIGVGRTMAAAVEQHHDAEGIVWPLALAPYEIVVVSLNPSDEATRHEADALYDALVREGLDVFYDDRDERPGVKFKDADLVGFPIRVNVGGRALKDGNVEIVSRRDKSARPTPKAEAVAAVRRLRAELAG
jgi:prolyl-tRNA synthetase